MKPISLAAFMKKYDPSVANIYPLQITEDLRLIQSTYNHNRWNTITNRHELVAEPCLKLMSAKFDLEQADKEEVQRYLFNIHYHRFNDSWHIETYRDESCEVYAKELCLKNKNWGRRYRESVIDAIWYKLNPPVFHYKDGRLKTGFFNHLKRRVGGYASSSWVTQYMTELGVEALKLELQTDDFDTIENHLKTNYNFGYNKIHQCPLSKKIGVTDYFKPISLSLTRKLVYYDVFPELYGYHIDRNNCWLLEYEVVIEDEIYDERSVEIIKCCDCLTSVVKEVTRNGKCLKCLGDDYKIKDYTFRVESHLNFKTHKKTPTSDERYLGIEIEYQVDKTKQGILYVGDKLKQHAMMKRDGSISNGFEIVSCPATYEVHMPFYKSFLDDLPDYIKPHLSCGMHVHINRRALTNMGAGKFTEFMNRADNEKFIYLMAGRGANNYQSRSNYVNIKTPFQVEKQRRVSDYVNTNRYNVVNLYNKNTIELRIFASPKNYKEFTRRMQFVKAMVEYCQPCQSSKSLATQTHWTSFVEWLNKQQKEFKELITYIKESPSCV